MSIVITGSNGFLGQRLVKTLLAAGSPFQHAQLRLTDVQSEPVQPLSHPQVTYHPLDLTAHGAAEQLIDQQTERVFHLAAIVSSQAEKDFDLGMQVNFTATQQLLQVIRQRVPQAKLIFTSSLAVFGGELSNPVSDITAVNPQSSYGTQKAMCELLINDYSRRGFVDGRVLRLPTISVRPGKPNQAASSFASGIIREPLQGQTAICPVAENLQLWLASPDTVIKNFLHAAQLDAAQFGLNRTVNLPGISVSVGQMLNDLQAIAGKQVRARVTFEPDRNIERIVASWPGAIDTQRAFALGFQQDRDFRAIIHSFIQHDLATRG